MDVLKGLCFSSWLSAVEFIPGELVIYLGHVENGHENFPQWCTLVIYKDKVGEQN